MTRKPMPLTEDEADVTRTLAELQQAMFDLHVAPVQERTRRHLRRIEERLELPAGAIGTTHSIEGDPLVIVEHVHPLADTQPIAPLAPTNGHKRRGVRAEAQT